MKFLWVYLIDTFAFSFSILFLDLKSFYSSLYFYTVFNVHDWISLLRNIQNWIQYV